MSEVREPSNWLFPGESELKRRVRREHEAAHPNVEYVEPIYTTLDSETVEAVKQVVRSDRNRLSCLDGILGRSDAILIKYDREEVPSRPAVRRVKVRIQKDLERFFGPHWRCERRFDKRYNDNRHDWILAIRRVEGYVFRYRDESDASFYRHRRGVPDGVDGDAEVWGDVFEYEPPGVEQQANIWVYEGGKKHLLPAYDLNYVVGQADGFYDTKIGEPVTTACSLEVSDEDLATGEDLSHYWEYAVAHAQSCVDFNDSVNSIVELNRRYNYKYQPHRVLGEEVCDSCANALGNVDEDGNYEWPRIDFESTLEWRVRDD
jgi:hypothetical protein